MIANEVREIFEFLTDMEEDDEDEMKGDNPTAFTRPRKWTPYGLLQQVFGQKGKTQQSELMDFYKGIDQSIDRSTVGFFQSRMKFNDAAIRTMSHDLITDKYDK